MALYFHIVELADGTWACRHGLQQYDQHQTREQARRHIRCLASQHRPASIYAHPRDARFEHLEDI
jgi:hypothetical protein